MNPLRSFAVFLFLVLATTGCISYRASQWQAYRTESFSLSGLDQAVIDADNSLVLHAGLRGLENEEMTIKVPLQDYLHEDFRNAPPVFRTPGSLVTLIGPRTSGSGKAVEIQRGNFESDIQLKNLEAFKSDHEKLFFSENPSTGHWAAVLAEPGRPPLLVQAPNRYSARGVPLGYFLFPITVPLDIATAPFQGAYWLWVRGGEEK